MKKITLNNEDLMKMKSSQEIDKKLLSRVIGGKGGGTCYPDTIYTRGGPKVPQIPSDPR